jgi:hypothetical protein
MSQQLSVTAGLLYDFPTHADFVVEEWAPVGNGEVVKHKDAGGSTYSSTETDPGEDVTAKLCVKATKTIPTNHTVLTFTMEDNVTTKKYIVTDISPMRDGALWKFTCKLEFKESMPTPT